MPPRIRRSAQLLHLFQSELGSSSFAAAAPASASSPASSAAASSASPLTVQSAAFSTVVPRHRRLSRIASASAFAPASALRCYASSAAPPASAARPADQLPASTYPTTSSSATASCSYPTSPASLRRTYGQPLPHSHPHLFPRRGPLGSEDLVAYPGQKVALDLLDPGDGLIATDQLTPGIPASEYESRRRSLMASLPDSSIVVLLSARMKSMSGNIFYKFRQDSNFWYLTGFQEPDSALLLEKDPSSSRGYRMTLYVPPRDDHNETWNGPRTGVDGATEVFGADDAHEMDPAVLLAHLKQKLPSYTHIYVDPPTQPSNPRRSASSRSSTSAATAAAASAANNMLNYLAPPSATGFDLFSKKGDFEQVVKLLGDTRKCHPLAREIERLRFTKSDNELRVMRRAGRISGEAMAQVMRFVEPGRSEAQLQAVFEYHCALHGAQRPAYVPVVAGGTNALTIHYINNDRLVGPDDLVCIDAGCELDGYASDITRAFPTSSSGRFTEPQRDLYTAVLNVLKGCTALATEDHCYTLADLHRRSVELLRLELKQLHFDLGANALERILYPHYVGHWLGIDLHDVASVERHRKLEPGTVVTIEPGVYVPLDDRFPKAFRGIGIRIEDDVAVLGGGRNCVLSAEAPKEVVDVERACEVASERETLRELREAQARKAGGSDAAVV